MADDFEYDEGENPFGAIDDMSGDFDVSAPTQDRNPVTASARNFTSTYKSNLLDNERNLKAIQESLPSGYSRSMDAVDQFTAGSSRIYRDATKELAGPMRDLAITTRRLTPRLRTLLPNSAVDKVDGWLDSYVERGGGGVGQPSQEEMDNHLIQSKTNDIFAKQLGVQAEQAQEQRVQKVIDDQVQTKRHEESKGLQAQLLQLVNDEADYRNSVTWRYQKEMLELNYRQYFSSRDLLENFKQYAAGSSELLLAIQKNTGLPEAQKINLSEQYREFSQQALFGKAHEALASKSGPIANRILNRLGVKVNEFTSEFGGIASELAGAGEMMADQMEMEEETGSGGGVDPIKMIMEGQANKLGKLTRDHVVKQANKILRENPQLARYNEEILDVLDNQAQYTQMVRDGELSEDAKWWQKAFRSFTEWIDLDDVRDHRVEVLNNLEEDATKAVPWDLLQRRSVTEIIPGFLARQLQQLKIIATGNPNTEMEVYSTQRESFVVESLAAYDAKQSVMPDEKIDELSEAILRFVDKVDDDHKLSTDARMALGRVALDDVRKGHTFNPALYAREEKWEKYDPSVSRELTSYISDKYEVDESEGTIKRSEANLARGRAARNAMRGIGNNLLDYQTGINRKASVSSKEILRTAGILRNTENGDEFVNENQDAATERALLNALNRSNDEQLERSRLTRGDLGPQLPPELLAQHQREYLDAQRANLTAYQRPETDNSVQNDTPANIAGIASNGVNLVKLINSQYEPLLNKQGGVAEVNDKPVKLKDTNQILKDQLIQLGKIREGIEGIGSVDGDGVTGGNGGQGLFSKMAHGVWGGLESYGRGVRNVGKFGLDTIGSARNIAASWLTRSPGGGGTGESVESDLYLGGSWLPKLRLSKLRAGEYFDAVSGNPITSWDDITGAVKDAAGNIVLTAEEAQQEFVTSKPNGGFVKRTLGKVAKAPFQLAGGLFNGGMSVAGTAHETIIKTVGKLAGKTGKELEEFNLADVISTVASKGLSVANTAAKGVAKVYKDMYSGITSGIRGVWGKFFGNNKAADGTPNHDSSNINAKDVAIKAINVNINGGIIRSKGIAGLSSVNDVAETRGKVNPLVNDPDTARRAAQYEDSIRDGRVIAQKGKEASRDAQRIMDVDVAHRAALMVEQLNQGRMNVSEKTTSVVDDAFEKGRTWLFENTNMTQDQIDNLSKEEISNRLDELVANGKELTEQSKESLSSIVDEFKSGDRTVASSAIEVKDSAKAFVNDATSKVSGLVNDRPDIETRYAHAKEIADTRVHDIDTAYRAANITNELLDARRRNNPSLVERINQQGNYTGEDGEQRNFFTDRKNDIDRLANSHQAKQAGERLAETGVSLQNAKGSLFGEESRLAQWVKRFGSDKERVGGQTLFNLDKLESDPLSYLERDPKEVLAEVIDGERYEELLRLAEERNVAREDLDEDLMELMTSALLGDNELTEKGHEILNKIESTLDTKLDNVVNAVEENGPQDGVFGDTDGDGRRQGSHLDIADRYRAARMKAKLGKNDPIPNKAGEKGADGGSGILGALGGLLGGIKDKVLGGVGALSSALGLGKLGGLLGGGAAASTTATTAASTVGAASKAGLLSSVGGGLKTAAMWGGRTLLGLVGGSTLLATAAVAGGVYAAKKGFDYAWRRSELEPLERLRFLQYGFADPDERTLVAIRYLESELSDEVKYDNYGVSSVPLQPHEVYQDHHEEFGLALEQKDFMDWHRWYVQRFLPVFTTNLTWCRIMSSGEQDARSTFTFGNLDLQDIDDEMDAEAKAEFVNKTLYTDGGVKGGPLPYSVMNCPFKPPVPMADTATVNAAKQALLSELGKSPEERAAEEKKLSESSSKAAATATATMAAAEAKRKSTFTKLDSEAKARADKAHKAMARAGGSSFVAGGFEPVTPKTQQAVVNGAEKKVRYGKGVQRKLDAIRAKQIAVGAGAVSVGTNGTDYMLPTVGRVSSTFGPRVHPVKGTTHHHSGVDIAAPTGTPVVAAQSGMVARKAYSKSYGNVVYINHDDGTQTRYAHLSGFSPTINLNEPIDKGSVLGYVGSTGVSTGPHLHYQHKQGQVQSAKNINPFDAMGDVGKTLNKQDLQLTRKSLDPQQGESNNDIDKDIEGVTTLAEGSKPIKPDDVNTSIALMTPKPQVSAMDPTQGTSQGVNSVGEVVKPEVINTTYEAPSTPNVDVSPVAQEVSRLGAHNVQALEEQRKTNELLAKLAEKLDTPPPTSNVTEPKPKTANGTVTEKKQNTSIATDNKAQGKTVVPALLDYS